MEYLLNIHTRTIHDADSTNGSCQIKNVLDGNKIIFTNYFEAKNYLPKGKKETTPCTFCLGKDYEQRIMKSE